MTRIVKSNQSPGGGCRQFSRSLRMGRRDLLRAGALGALSLGSADLVRAIAGAAASGEPEGQAKACIFFFMWGGPSQLDTFDLKPDAPVEVRGEFSPIATVTNGISICEHFQKLARHTDKLALIRSLNHDDPAHLSSGHTTLTGHLAPVIKSDAEPPSDRDTPHIGSVLARLRQAPEAMPPFVTMPWLAYHPAAPGGRAPGQSGGWLGRRYDPFLITGDPNQDDFRIEELSLPSGLSVSRLRSRRELLRSIDAQRRDMDAHASRVGLDSFQERAFSMLSAPAAREAFDLSLEEPAVRERYGRNIHGQCALFARRLVERGVPLVSINWHNDGRNFWDTHGNNFNRLKKDLIPPADTALSTLLEELSERGLLDSTLVVWVGEFGRKPQISAGNAGREHWPWCYSGLLAGGGIRGGMVHGASDAHAARPAQSPVSPQDFAATIYEALGISSRLTLPDPLGRPVRFCTGEPIWSVLA